MPIASGAGRIARPKGSKQKAPPPAHGNGREQKGRSQPNGRGALIRKDDDSLPHGVDVSRNAARQSRT